MFCSPEGTAEKELLALSRPFGTSSLSAYLPNVETLGYYRFSLREKNAMTSHNCHFADSYLSRRTFLSKAAHGVGKVALASLLSPSLFSAALAATKRSSSDKWSG